MKEELPFTWIPVPTRRKTVPRPPHQPSPPPSAAKNREEAALDGLHSKRWAAYIWKALTRHSVNPTAATKRRSLKFHRESPVQGWHLAVSLWVPRVCRLHEPHLPYPRIDREQRSGEEEPCSFARIVWRRNVVSKQWPTLIGLRVHGRRNN